MPKKRKAPAPPKSTKLPRKLPDDPIARGVEATGQSPKANTNKKRPNAEAVCPPYRSAF